MAMRLICPALVFLAAVLASRTVTAQAHLSPQAVYEAAQQHYLRHDYEAVVNCMTPDSLELWAGVAVINAFDLKKGLQDQGSEKRAALDVIDSLLLSHGVQKDRLTKFVWNSLFAFTERQKTKLYDDLILGIEHKPRFFHEVMTELAKHDEEQGKFEPLLYRFLAYPLSDVRIDRDQATGRITETNGDKPETKTIRFRRTDQGWLIYVEFAPEE